MSLKQISFLEKHSEDSLHPVIEYSFLEGIVNRIGGRPILEVEVIEQLEEIIVLVLQAQGSYGGGDGTRTIEILAEERREECDLILERREVTLQPGFEALGFYPAEMVSREHILQSPGEEWVDLDPTFETDNWDA